MCLGNAVSALKLANKFVSQNQGQENRPCDYVGHQQRILIKFFFFEGVVNSQHALEFGRL